MGTKRKHLSKKTVIISVVSVFLAVSVFLCIAPKLGLPFSWKTLFQKIEPKSATPISTNAEIHFIDVGQGDSALVISKGSAALIDCGDEGYGDKICDVLAQNGIEQLEFIVFSHSDSDHIGGADEVLKEIPVKTIYADKVPFPDGNDDFLKAEEIAGKNNVEIIAPADNSSVTLGEAEFEFYVPDLSDKTDENENGIIVAVNIMGLRTLFTGDIGKSTELAMIKSGYPLDCDILKVGHHGSKHSSCDKFLNAVSPDYSVISVGQNSYGHPTKEVLQRLEKVGSETLRTDLCGTICFTFTPDGRVSIET